MSGEPSLAQMARAALGASTQTSDPEVASWYCATARIAYAKALEELASIERVLLSREAELSHAHRRSAQKRLALDEAKP